MKFGFLAHPVSSGQRGLVRAASMVSAALAERTGGPPADPARLRVPLYSRVRSAAGECRGEVRYLPHTAEELIGGRGATEDYVVDQVDHLVARGARLVGLGGATSIVGDRGLRLQSRVAVPLTSGNSLTTYAAHVLVHRVFEAFGERAADRRIGVIGFPGAIGLAMTRLLLDDGCSLVLGCRRGRVDPELLLAELPDGARDRVRVTDDLSEVTAAADTLITASSAGGVLSEDLLRPGTVVIDVALPRDVVPASRRRRDVLVLDGGLMSASDAVVVDGSAWGPTRQLNGCLAETIVLALDGRAEAFSLGRSLDVDRIREVGAMAARHGFVVAEAACRGALVRDDDWTRVAAHRERPATRPAPRRVQDAERLARRRFTDHINPPMARLYGEHGIDRVFVTGRGANLITADGTEFLDFVAGYGSLNVGHNHPRVTAALSSFLASGTPSFVQYTSIPHRTAELAERLCALAPGGLERVFFGNSGTEAVEAALKLARAATGRTRLVHTLNSYHGKTLGALSVTGSGAHAAPFSPLLPDTRAVPFGDVAALREAVVGAAAFIVEPVQGEGGVILPPPGYLAEAQRLCREAGALFVVDEIQTGLGRTGAMFACDRDGLRPDVLCLAKSLSGGLVPIGATLATAAVWDAAYGTSSRALLHTSTFGGGNLAASVALATLDVLEEEKLVRRSAVLGDRLRAELAEACAPFDFVAEVRGVGMMNAVAFRPAFEGAAEALLDDVLTRFPGRLRDLAGTLPDTIRSGIRDVGRDIERALGDLLCMRFVAALGTEHNVLAFVTANSNQVMRIQPPLVVGEHEVDRFVKAVRAVCETTAHVLHR